MWSPNIDIDSSHFIQKPIFLHCMTAAHCTLTPECKWSEARDPPFFLGTTLRTHYWDRKGEWETKKLVAKIQMYRYCSSRRSSKGIVFNSGDVNWMYTSGRQNYILKYVRWFQSVYWIFLFSLVIYRSQSRMNKKPGLEHINCSLICPFGQATKIYTLMRSSCSLWLPTVISPTICYHSNISMTHCSTSKLVETVFLSR